LTFQESCLPNGVAPPQAYYVTAGSPYSSVADTVYSPCHEDCLSCNGPLSNDCQSCKSSFQPSSQMGQISQCLASCTQSNAPSVCQDCHPQCNGCSGSGNERCESCLEGSTITSGLTVCVPFCAGGTYLGRVSDTSFEYECQTCHSQCRNCSGPSNLDCEQCREASILTSEGETTCVPGCDAGQYLELVTNTNSEYQCQPCHSQCQTCNGPQNTNCLACVAVNFTSNGVSNCLTSCPTETYESRPNRLCQACHEQCSGGCSGPSNRNCTACSENTMAVSPGVTECTSFATSCSFGMEYNSATSMCAFSL